MMMTGRIKMDKEKIVYEDKWLQIHEEKPKPKTRVFSVWSKCSGVVLGKIQWYSSWRHYCFIVTFRDMLGSEEFIFSDRCMLAIGEFMEKLNKEHSKKAKVSPSQKTGGKG